MSERRNRSIPDIEFPYPPCPICDGDLEHWGDSWECSECGISWRNNGTDGERYAETEGAS